MKGDKLLNQLLQGLAQHVPPIVVGGIKLHADSIQPGDVFFAYAGDRRHGAEFIDQAIDNGARAVVLDEHVDVSGLHAVCPVIIVPELRRHVGAIAKRFYGNGGHIPTVGITGTNGKTSCSHFLAQALQFLGGKCFVIGTLGNGLFPQLQSSALTTPDALQVHALLAHAKDLGATLQVMEVSSHALTQYRADGVDFDVAVFTNISQDHLDYHGDMDHYMAAKKRLFHFPGLKHAVINWDDPAGRQIAGALPAGVEQVGYGMAGGQYDLSARILDRHHNGMRLAFDGRWGSAQVDSGLIGDFNVANLMAVMGTLLSMHWSWQDVLRAIAGIKSIAGRLEQWGGDGLPLAIIDFAHTPDALQQALQNIAAHLGGNGRLWCVFGCGGDRDRGKRPMMGSVAERYADRVIVTDDNPRHEDPAQIRADILRGFHKRDDVHEEPDRARAIKFAMHHAAEQDIVLVAGKGHENYQIVADQRLAFSDRDQVKQCLKELAA